MLATPAAWTLAGLVSGCFEASFNKNCPTPA